MTGDRSPWRRLHATGPFEYWQLGEGPTADIYRRRISDDTYEDAGGGPVGARYEGSRAWFDQWVAPTHPEWWAPACLPDPESPEVRQPPEVRH